MYRKILTAMVAVSMAILSFSTVAFAADATITLDAYNENMAQNGYLEQDAVGWKPDGTVQRVTDVTYGESAGAALITQTGSSFAYPPSKSLTGGKYYRASAMVRLTEGTDNAYIAVDDFAQGSPVAVSDSDWSLVELQFYCEDDVQYPKLTVRCESADEFYVDNVELYEMSLGWDNCVIVTGEDLPEGAEVVAAKATGEVLLTQAIKTLAAQNYKLSAYVMLAEDSDAETPTAKMGKAGRSTVNTFGDPTTLVPGDWVEVSWTTNLDKGSDRKVGIKIEGVGAEDVVYVKDFSAVAVEGQSEAEVTVRASIEDMIAGNDTVIDFDVNNKTVAVRYFYLVADSADAPDAEWTIVKSYLTNKGTTEFDNIFISSDYAGKYIKLRVDPLDQYGRFGESSISEVAAITALLEVDEPAVTESVEGDIITKITTINITNTSGAQQAVAVIVAYYNDNDEMIALGIENAVIENGDEVPVSVGVVKPEGNYYSKAYICGGSTGGTTAYALNPLANAFDVAE